VTAFFVAFNPIWGFSWYFNTESWATGVYQKMTQLRIDPWRVKMTDAITRAHGGSDDLFRIEPGGLEGGDFSFLVIGDPGEGDASQYSLVSRYLALGRRDDVKFLVVCSDVIYPAGSMHDYEANFYLPFQGFAKPIYAIPGNHDWYDALEGFNANFLEPKAARAAIEARVEADLGLTSTNARRIDKLMAEAARLRRQYGVDVGTQRAPFFELQTEDFALLAIDTGVLRTVDERQWAWIERALGRSRGKFIMAIVGHPRFAGARDLPPTAEGHDVSESSGNFAALYRLLARHNVRIALAGDTHDFEYYREKIGGAGGSQVMHHFVNGGGGAYLSIGTALDFAKQPAVDDWAFYPRTDILRAKMDAEMPMWKQPFWYWIKWFKAWPFHIEALSGVFEVRVERSKRRVVFALNGIHGPLQWRDLQTGGTVLPPGATLDDPVEFIVQMDRE
jgi:Calcineurin-like phosphoesterase